MLEPDQCNDLVKPSITQFVVSCSLMGWLLICYIPQWGRIILRRSAEGLSTYYILLGSLSGVCAVGNIMMLPSSAVDIGCCRTNTRFACIRGLLGMLQVIFGIACFWIVLFMYVYYSEEEADAELHGRRPSLSGPDRTFRRAKRAWKVLIAACSFAFAVLLVSAIILHRFPWYAQAWADILGIAVAVFACIQWVPQVRTTWHLGHLGSLSPVSICLTAPYTWIFGINMMIRVGLKGWSAWVVYVLVGTMQIVLIVLAICFAVRDQRLAKQGKQHCATPANFEGWNTWTRSRTSSVVSHAHSHLAPDERSPLLYEQPSSRRQTVP
ncbi:PQ loop repeat-containing protein [Cladophialophora immunda]|nr:PQ loop repeat-containing protein [Cladophialophora immunda]